MANSTSPVPQVVEGAGAVASINELFDAGSQATIGGRWAAGITGPLKFAVLGGRAAGVEGANTEVTLTASNTNYVVRKKSDGVVSVSTATTNWNNSTDYWRLYSVVAGVSAVTSYTDERLSAEGLFGGGGGGTSWASLTGVPAPIEDIAALTDPGADRILFWDDSAGEYTHLTVGSGLSITTTTLSASGGGSGDVVGPASAVDDRIATFDSTTGKLIQDGGKTIAELRAPSIQSVASSATVTPTFSDDMVKITAQAAGLTLANPTGTAIDGLGMVIRIKDNGTARTIAYGSQYRAIGVTLPSTTVISKTLYLAMVFNNDDTKWDVVAVGQEA
jgi:hypothetical protein